MFLVRLKLYVSEQHIPIFANKPFIPTRAWSPQRQIRKPAKLRTQTPNALPNFNPRTMPKTALPVCQDLPLLLPATELFKPQHLLLHLPSHNLTCNNGKLSQALLRHSSSTPAAFLSVTDELSVMPIILSFKQEKACAKTCSMLEQLILLLITY